MLDARGDRLLDAVLDHRLVDERQHLLGLRLRRGQEPGPPACGWKDGFSDAQGYLVLVVGCRPRWALERRRALHRAARGSVGGEYSPAQTIGPNSRLGRHGGAWRDLQHGRSDQHGGTPDELHWRRLLAKQQRRQGHADERLDRHQDRRAAGPDDADAR